jgi:deoxyribodipyrimidine photolyase-like uncharacterized protein
MGGLPNSLGMSQFADGGIMASGNACPFTTLYWD